MNLRGKTPWAGRRPGGRQLGNRVLYNYLGSFHYLVLLSLVFDLLFLWAVVGGGIWVLSIPTSSICLYLFNERWRQQISCQWSRSQFIIYLFICLFVIACWLLSEAVLDLLFHIFLGLSFLHFSERRWFLCYTIFSSLLGNDTNTQPASYGSVSDLPCVFIALS